MSVTCPEPAKTQALAKLYPGSYHPRHPPRSPLFHSCLRFFRDVVRRAVQTDEADFPTSNPEELSARTRRTKDPPRLSSAARDRQQAGRATSGRYERGVMTMMVTNVSPPQRGADERAIGNDHLPARRACCLGRLCKRGRHVLTESSVYTEPYGSVNGFGEKQLWLLHQ